MMYKIKEQYLNHTIEIPKLNIKICLDENLTSREFRILEILGYQYLFDKTEDEVNNKEKSNSKPKKG